MLIGRDARVRLAVLIALALQTRAWLRWLGSDLMIAGADVGPLPEFQSIPSVLRIPTTWSILSSPNSLNSLKTLNGLSSLNSLNSLNT
jgi:hypothetical protein